MFLVTIAVCVRYSPLTPAGLHIIVYVLGVYQRGRYIVMQFLGKPLGMGCESDVDPVGVYTL